MSSDDDDEYDECGKVALAYDPRQLSGSDGPPQNGHDYLKFVQDERIKYPSISYSTKPLCKSSQENPPNENQQQQSSSSEVQMETTSLPTEESKSKTKSLFIDNCDEIIENFEELRRKIEEIRATYPEGLQINQQEAKLLTKIIDSNHSTCLDKGDDSYDNNDVENETNSQQKRQSKEKQLKRLEEVSNNLLKSKELGKTPKVSDFIQLSQMELRFTLDKLADEYEIMPQYSEIPTDWIYSIMAALREPIEADICSTLRRLARLCIAKRDSYNKMKQQQERQQLEEEQNNMDCDSQIMMMTSKEYTSCLLIICIVHYYFGQTDLK